MQDEWFDSVAIPALLRHARRAYGRAMRIALLRAGFDGVPANGMYVLGGLAEGNVAVPPAQLIGELGISGDAVGRLIEALVVHDYLVREYDPGQRETSTVRLTNRGIAAAAVQRAAREGNDAELEASVGADDVRRTRRTLAVLCDIGRQAREDGGDAE